MIQISYTKLKYILTIQFKLEVIFAELVSTTPSYWYKLIPQYSMYDTNWMCTRPRKINEYIASSFKFIKFTIEICNTTSRNIFINVNQKYRIFLNMKILTSPSIRSKVTESFSQLGIFHTHWDLPYNYYWYKLSIGNTKN